MRNSNIFFIVYDLDFYSLPVAYCENMQELGKFFKHNSNTMRSMLSRHHHRNKNKQTFSHKGKRYSIAKFEENRKTKNVKQLFIVG